MSALDDAVYTIKELLKLLKEVKLTTTDQKTRTLIDKHMTAWGFNDENIR